MISTSSHLQVPRAARPAETRKDGTRIFCRLAGDEVAVFMVTAADLARSSGRRSGVTT